jgi:hypothetical protein
MTENTGLNIPGIEARIEIFVPLVEAQGAPLNIPPT